MINNITVDLCASVLEVAKTSRIRGNYHYLVCTGLLVSGVNPKSPLEAVIAFFFYVIILSVDILTLP